jgi:L-amino acid N-acyltransferase YncA
VKVRSATDDDIQDIARILTEALVEEPFVSNNTSMMTLEEGCRAMQGYREKGIDLYVADDEGVVVGFVSCNKYYHSGGLRLFIPDLYVAQGKRGKGVGTLLLDAVEEKYVQEGVRIIELITNDCGRAMSFYENAGFNKTRDVRLEKLLKNAP